MSEIFESRMSVMLKLFVGLVSGKKVVIIAAIIFWEFVIFSEGVFVIF